MSAKPTLPCTSVDRHYLPRRYRLSCSLCVAWKPYQAITVDRVSHWLPFPEALPHKVPRREQGQSWLTALNVSWKLWGNPGKRLRNVGGRRLAGRGTIPRVLLGSRLSRGNWGLWLGTLFTTVVNFELCPSPSRFKRYLVGAQALWTDPHWFPSFQLAGTWIKSKIGRLFSSLE